MTDAIARVIPMPTLPGVKRDGTELEGDNWSDGTWARFNSRGKPLKMGGFNQISSQLAGVSRGIWAAGSGSSLYVHSGNPNGVQVQQFVADTLVPMSSAYDRTPGTFGTDAQNMWTFDQFYNSAGTDSYVIAHVAPNGSGLASQNPGTIFYGTAYGTTALTPLGSGTIPPGTGTVDLDPHVSGGIVVLNPFLFAYGNTGQVYWSNPGNPTTVAYNTARITEQKIVKGLESRAGAGYSPAGLFWSLNALVRATFNSGTTQFSFDTVSDKTSILAQNSVVELDGVFYWIAVDRFLQYTGIISEVPNDLCLEDFFQNVNFSARQKIWATKVPKWGEVVWFYPRGTATECNWMVCFSPRLSKSMGRPIWYDSPLPAGMRTAGVYPDICPYPVYAGELNRNGSTYNLYQHEIGYNQQVDGNVLAIASGITSSDLTIAIGGTDVNTRLTRVEMDAIQSGDIEVTRVSQAFARSATISFGEAVGTSRSVVDDIRGQGRELRLGFSSNVVDGYYEFGQILLHIQPGDVRPR